MPGRRLAYDRPGGASDDVVGLLWRPEEGPWRRMTCQTSLRNVDQGIRLLLDREDGSWRRHADAAVRGGPAPANGDQPTRWGWRPWLARCCGSASCGRISCCIPTASARWPTCPTCRSWSPGWTTGSWPTRSIVTEGRLLAAVQAQLGPQVETLRTPPYKPETRRPVRGLGQDRRAGPAVPALAALLRYPVQPARPGREQAVRPADRPLASRADPLRPRLPRPRLQPADRGARPVRARLRARPPRRLPVAVLRPRRHRAGRR